jgi:hypothetical protein
VDHGAWRNISQRQRVAHQDVRLGTAQNFLPYFQTFRLENVTLLSIRIGQQRDAGGSVRIVLDRLHHGRNAGFVALEVDDAQLALVAATNEPHGDIARVAPSAGALLGFHQRLVRILRRDVVVDEGRAIAQRLRRRSVCFDRHVRNLYFVVGRQSLVVSKSRRTTNDR